MCCEKTVNPTKIVFILNIDHNSIIVIRFSELHSSPDTDINILNILTACFSNS